MPETSAGGGLAREQAGEFPTQERKTKQMGGIGWRQWRRRGFFGLWNTVGVSPRMGSEPFPSRNRSRSTKQVR